MYNYSIIISYYIIIVLKILAFTESNGKYFELLCKHGVLETRVSLFGVDPCSDNSCFTRCVTIHCCLNSLLWESYLEQSNIAVANNKHR